MKYLYKVCIFCALLAVLHEVALADREDKSDETSEVQESTEVAEGPPDSHEAMNNREINPITKTRQKRSYEFLMGLINNNSTYQLTKDEPAINLSKKQGESNENIEASELLLELMIKIAGNPKQWSKVHHLLRQIDQDILTSKQLVDDYQNHTIEMQNLLQEANLQLDKKQDVPPRTPAEDIKEKKYMQAEINKEVAITSDNGQPDINTGLFMNSAIPTLSSKEWPTFPNVESRVNFVDTDISSNTLVDHIKSSNTGSSTTKAYPKYFSYHRVTGKPVFINKNPKAYVAVSVVASKSIQDRSNEDLELEHELRQLKPWTHSRNLKNMEALRSRWVIDRDSDKKTSEEA